MSTPAQFLLQHFDRLAEAPGGIAKLRALVLQLAITGKLLPQSKADESATKLLARIRTEKARITKKPVPSTPIDRSEVEVQIPAEWEWIKLGDLCSKTGSGSTPRGGKTAYKTSGIPFLRSQNVYDDGLRLDGVAYITPEIHAQMSGTAVVPGDLLLNITGGSIGRCAIVPESFTEGNVSQHVAILRPAIAGMSGYLHLVILSPHFQTVMLGSQTGAGREGLPKNRMDEILIPLPPLAEQRRIVAKVEELMGLCDALEAAQQEREAVRTRLRTSTLHQLASPDSNSKSTAFALQHLPRLTLEPEDLAHLRRSVLELAVAGKLTRQLKGDETAQKLVERMDKARRALAKPPKLSALPDELPSELPSNWTWQPLCALLSEPSQNGYSQSADESPDGVPLLRISAGTSRGDGDVEETDFKRTTLDAATKAKFALQVGDLLAVRFNGNLHFTGKVTIYRGKLGMLQIFPDKLIRLRVWTEFVATEYVRLAMSAPVIRTAIESFCATSVGNMGISATDLVTVPIPLPPLAEQRRIVAKVDELMAVLDALAATLTTVRTTSERLLAAIVAKLHAA